MNVLIVDDNKNNRMILTLLLEDYSDDNGGIAFEVDEAADGLEAIEKCSKKKYDIVFMDIMMPNMDGIEATKIIRKEHKKLMIIAVSAVDDTDRQKLILSNGAEDYISKPVNADIFNTRIGNYITLIGSRDNDHIKKNTNCVNLFTKEIFSRYTNFILSSEDSLSELWEYYLLDDKQKDENLSDVIRTIFSIAETQLKLKISSNLYVEESEDSIFFTITEVDKLPEMVIKLIFKKNSVNSEYKNESGKISFKLAKLEPEEIELAIEEVKQVVKKVEVKEEPAVPTVNFSSAKLEVFDYIEQDDMYDLEEFIGKLSSLMLMVGSGDVSVDEAAEMYGYLDKIGSILSTYSEVYVMSTALSDLSSAMSSNIEEFLTNSEAIGPMCAAFSNDLRKWMQQSFYTGAPSADFMNDTIVVNCQTISSMLTMNDAPASDEDFDDIFDF